jgi:hypothetical protein
VINCNKKHNESPIIETTPKVDRKPVVTNRHSQLEDLVGCTLAHASLVFCVERKATRSKASAPQLGCQWSAKADGGEPLKLEMFCFHNGGWWLLWLETLEDKTRHLTRCDKVTKQYLFEKIYTFYVIQSAVELLTCGIPWWRDSPRLDVSSAAAPPPPHCWRCARPRESPVARRVLWKTTG